MTKEEATPLNSGFRVEDKLDVTITGGEFASLVLSAESLFDANIKQVRPLRFRYYDKNNELVVSPTKKQFDNNELVEVFDPLAFMSANNLINAYVGDVNPAVMEARRILFEIQEQGIKQGKAVLIEDLIKEQDEANKSKHEAEATV